MRRRSLPAALLLSALAALLAGCDPGPPAAARPNILLLSVDTLRADHLGCYGHERDTSPHLDAFAAAGVRYAHARAPAPWTLPSHGAMLTGVHPWLLGMRHGSSALPPAVPTLAERLTEAGYSTAAFVDSSRKGYVGGQRGFARGFDDYRHAPHAEGGWSKYDMAATVDAGLGWIAEQRRARPGSPFFLFLHTKSVHTLPSATECLDARCFPYDKRPPFRFRFFDPGEEPRVEYRDPERGKAQEVLWWYNREIGAGTLTPAQVPGELALPLPRLYDAGVAYTDHHIGRVLAGLAELGLEDDTVVLVTADHGESFLDHSFFLHTEVYEALLRVPLLLRLPAGVRSMAAPAAGSDVPAGGPAGSDRPAQGVVEETVALEDIVPTLLQLAGLPVPAAVTGRALPLPGDAAGAPREHFSYYLFPGHFDYVALALEAGGHKLIRHKLAAAGPFALELYDLTADPGETAPLDDPERAAELARRLEALVRRPPLVEPASLDDGDAAAAAIRTLGYID